MVSQRNSRHGVLHSNLNQTATKRQRPNRLSAKRGLLAAVAAAALAVTQAHAATSTWTGGGADGNWTTPANWGGTAPVANNSLVFAGTTNLTTTNNFASGSPWFSGITFNAGSGAFVLGGNLTALNGAITDNATNTQTINLALTLEGNETFTTASGGALVITGIIAGANTYDGFTTAGTGTLTLSGANTYTGKTTIGGGGILSLGSSGALGTTGNITFTGGTLQFTASNTTDYSTRILNSTAAAINLDVNGQTVTFASPLSSTNTAGLTLNATGGTGTLILSVANNYTGPTTVNAGTLDLQNSLALQNSTLTTVGFIFDGVVSSHAFTFGGLIGSGNITLADTASNAVALSVGNDNVSTIYAGVLSSTGSLTKLGTGFLTLTGANTYSGGTTLTAGEVNLGIAQNGTTSGPLGASGTITLNGGYLQYSSVNTYDYSPRFSTVAGAQYNADTNGQNVTWATALTSSGGNLTKSGTGTLTLNGNNTYSGTTTINGGTLQVGTGTAGSLNGATGTALTFSDTGIINFHEGNNSSQSMTALTFSAGDGTVQSTYPASGNITLTFPALATRTPGATANFYTSGGTNGTTNQIILTGQAAGFIDQGTFFDGGSSSANYAYYTGSFVRGINYTSDTGAYTTAATTSIATSGVAVGGGTTLYAQTTGNISSQGNATFSTLNIVNTGNTAQVFTLATGTTLATNGILRSGNGGLGSATTLSGGTGIQAATTSGELVLRTDQANDLLTISTPILANGSSGLTKSGAGNLTLSAANTYTGTTTLNAGALILNNAAALGPTSGAGRLVINGGTLTQNVLNGTLTLTSNNPMTWNGNFMALTNCYYQLNMGTGPVTLGNNIAISTGYGSSGLYGTATELTVGGVIGDGGNNYGLTIVGNTTPGANSSGAVVLTGNNTFGGGVTLATSGNLSVGNLHALGTGLFTINGGTYIQTLAGGLTGISGVVINGSTTMSTNDNTGTAPVTLMGASSITTSIGAVTIGGNISGTGSLALTDGLWGGSMTLSGANNFTGGLTVTAATTAWTIYLATATSLGTGTLTINPPGSGGNITLSSTAPAGTTWTNNNPQAWKTSFTWAGNSVNTGTGNVTLGLSPTITVTAATVTEAGVIGDGGLGYGITKAGTGNLSLTAANTFSGATGISAGVLQVANTLALQNSTVTMPTTAADLVFNSGIGSFTFGGISGGANHALTDASSAGVTLSVGNNNGSPTYTGNLSGAGNLTKIGTGTLTLSGANGYTGATTVNNGILSVTGSLNSTVGGVSVGNTVTTGLNPSLAGTGTIAGSLTVTGSTSGSAGHVAPGVGAVGTLTVGGSAVSFNNGSVLDYYFGTSTSSQLALSNSGVTLTLPSGSGAVTLNNTNSYGFVASGSVELISFPSTATVANFNNSPGYVVGGNGANLGSAILGAGFTSSEKYELTGNSTGIFLNYESASTSNNATYTVTASSSTAMLHAADVATITTTLTNAGGNGSDSVNYTGLQSTVSPTGSTTLSSNPISGGPVASPNSVSTTQTFSATTAGNYTFTPTNNITGNSTTATGSVTPTTLSVFSGNASWANNAGGVWGSGASANWIDNTNSAIGAAPGTFGNFTTTDTAIFPDILGAGSTVSVDLGSVNPSLSTLTFTAMNSSYTITADSGGMLHLNGGLGNAAVNVAGTHTISAPVSLDGNTTVTANSNSSLAISGIISNTNGSGLVKNGAGTLTLSGNNTYTGTTILNAGNLTIGGNSALGTGRLVINGGNLSSNASQTLTNAQTWNGNFTINGYYTYNLTMNTGAVALTNNVTITQGTNNIYSPYWYSDGFVENGVISGNYALTVSGAATPGVTLGGNNTFTGGVTVTNSGYLTVTNPNALGTGNLTLTGGAIFGQTGSPVTGLSGIIIIGSTQLWTNPTANLGTVPVTLVGNAAVSVYCGTATIGGNIAGVGAGLTVTNSNYSGTLVLSGNNTFSGGVTAWVGNGNGTFTLDANSATALGTGTLTLNPGVNTLYLDNTSGAAVTLTNSNPQVWNTSFTFAGTNSLNMGNGAVTLSLSPTITVNNNTFTQGGVIGDGSHGYGITKAGAGNLTLLAANTYTGITTISAGTLLLGNGNSGYDGSVAGNIANNAALAYNLYGNQTYAGVISGTGTLTKSGAGMLTLTGSNTYSGNTTVTAGTLAVANASGSATGTGKVNINAGVLGGNGTLVPTGTSGTLISLASGAILSPSLGAATTTTLNANVSSSSSAAAFNIAGGAILNYNFAAPGTSDTLNVTGKVTLASGTDTLNINQLTGFGVGNYTMLSATSLTDNVGNWTLPSSTQYLYAVIANSTALMLDVTANGPATMVWSGNTSGSWDTASANWQSAAVYADTDLVVFDDTASGNFVVDLGGATVNPGNVTVNNSVNAYSIGNGTIGGNATLTKNGTNTLTLTGNNTYSGGTTVNAGTLDVATATNGLLAGGNVTNYAALQFDGSQSLGTISGNGTTTVSGTGSLTVGSISQTNLINNGAVTVNGTGTVATLSDTSGLGSAGNTTISSTGNLTVTGFAQASLINNGITSIIGTGTIGQLSGTGSLNIGNGSLANTVTLAAAATSGVLGGIKPTQGLVTIASGSTLDITNNALLLNYGGNGTSPLAAVANAVAYGAGKAGNASSNGAIISSTVNTSAAGKYAVGYADHTEISSIPTGNVEVAYTLAGDANLDGSVDILDYQQMAPHYDEAGTYDWSQGDFNHDGHVDILDYQAMAPNYDTKLTAGTLLGADSLTASASLTAADLAKPIGGAVAAAELQTVAGETTDGITATNITAAIPEPASLSLLLLGGIPLLGRRRRKVRKAV